METPRRCECALTDHHHPETEEGPTCPSSAAFVVQTIEAWETGASLDAEDVALCEPCAPDALWQRIGPLTLPVSG